MKELAPDQELLLGVGIGVLLVKGLLSASNTAKEKDP